VVTFLFPPNVRVGVVTVTAYKQELIDDHLDPCSAFFILFAPSSIDKSWHSYM
jgi:hypothetical protein